MAAPARRRPSANGAVVRALVLGEGFVAEAAAGALIARGHAVAAPGLGTQSGELPGLRPLPESGLAGFRPDVLIHTGLTTQRQTESFVNEFEPLGCRFVILSSADVYRAYGRLMRQEPGKLEPMPATEDSPLRGTLFVYRRMARSDDDPLLNYDKRLVEDMLRRTVDSRTTIIRAASVYGPGDPDRHLFPILKRIDDGRSGIIIGETPAGWSWSWVYVDNLAVAIAEAATRTEAAGRTYNVADEPTLTQREWVTAVGTAAGWEGEVVVVPDAMLPRHLVPSVDVRQDLVLDTARIRTELAYKPVVDSATALSETVRWTREHPPEQVDARRFDYAAEDLVLSRLQPH
jgi:nucleoside-diphosphate-sugar epimerase